MKETNNGEQVDKTTSWIGSLISVLVIGWLLQGILTLIFRVLGQSQPDASQNASAVIWVGLFILMVWMVANA